MHLKSAFDGLYWAGPQNHFSIQNNYGNTFLFASGAVFLNTQALPFSFTKKIMQSGFLNNEIKNNAVNKLKDYNGARFGYKYGSGFCTRIKKKEIGLEISEESVSILNYRKDLFGLVFFGNADYEDDTIFMRGSGIINQDFHRARFIFSTISGVGDSSWQMNISLSYLQGYHVNVLSVGNAKLYTAPMGEYLWMNSKFIFQTNDTTQTGSFAFNGNGISLDLNLAFPAGKSQMMFAINDAGFIHWNNQSLFYAMDTTLKFEGVELVNVFTDAGSNLQNINTDSIFNYLGVKQNKKGFNVNLPLRFSFIWHRLLNKNKIGLIGGISFLPQYENIPMVFCSATYNFQQIQPAVTVSYGGFQRFNMGMNVSGKITKHFKWMLGSNQMLSWLVADRFSGVDFYSQLSYSF